MQNTHIVSVVAIPSGEWRSNSYPCVTVVPVTNVHEVRLRNFEMLHCYDCCQNAAMPCLSSTFPRPVVRLFLIICLRQAEAAYAVPEPGCADACSSGCHEGETPAERPTYAVASSVQAVQAAPVPLQVRKGRGNRMGW